MNASQARARIETSGFSYFRNERELQYRTQFTDDPQVSNTRVAIMLTSTRCTLMHKDSEQPKTHEVSPAFVEYFRCPDEFASFESLSKKSTSKGLFHLS